MKKVAIILSGGMDSTALLSSLLKDGYEVIPIHFQYGSKHNGKELQSFVNICAYYNLINSHIIDIDFNKMGITSDLLTSGGDIPEGHYEAPNMKSTVVPFRNGIMLSMAAGIAESLDCEELYYGAHAGDHAIYPDCREEFFNYMAEAVRVGTYKGIALRAPFLNIDKGGIAAIGCDNKAPFILTWTCYKGQSLHCGKCGACQERIEAFAKFNLKDPVEYECIQP